MKDDKILGSKIRQAQSFARNKKKQCRGAIAIVTTQSRMTLIKPPPLQHSPPILSLLRACKTIAHLEQLHSLIIRKGSEQDHFLINQFISLYNTFANSSFSSSNKSDYPTSIFERVLQPNAFIWNSLIKFYSQHASLSNSFSLLNRMRKCFYVKPDEYTFTPLIKASANALDLTQGRVIHGLTIRYGIRDDVFVGSSLVDFYGKCKDIDSAFKVFAEMGVRNEVSWTAMIVGFVNCGDLVKAKQLFDEMPERNLASWNAIIGGFVRVGELGLARKLFDEMVDKDVVSYTIMIDGYAKAGDLATARFLFDQSPEKDVVSWSALISGYAQNGRPSEAVKVFLEMNGMNVEPDEFVMVGLMSACSQLGCLELAKWIDSYMSCSAFNLKRSHVAAALVDMNAKCGNMDRAMALFEEMPNRDVILYCSMIQGLTIHGQGVQAVRVIDRMLSEGLIPDSVAFTVILTACSRAGLFEEGCRFFDSMINKYSLNPSPDHYACMVDLLGRSGKLEAAYEMIKSMPVEPHASAWGALLGACKLHSNLELGEEVARMLFELEPHSGSNYVLLSDIYAAADRWLDVSLLRSKMSDRGIRKIPGCSWI